MQTEDLTRSAKYSLENYNENVYLFDLLIRPKAVELETNTPMSMANGRLAIWDRFNYSFNHLWNIENFEGKFWCVQYIWIDSGEQDSIKNVQRLTVSLTFDLG